MKFSGYLSVMWNNMETWQLLAAIVCGILVGFIYFQSLRWSVNRLSESKHKVRMFASVALCRILLFFGVMVLIAQRNVVVILIYVLCFYFTKVAIIAFEKGHILKDEGNN